MLGTAIAVLAALSGSVAWVAIHNPAVAVANRQEPQAVGTKIDNAAIAVTVGMATDAKIGAKRDDKNVGKIDANIVAMIDAQAAAGRDDGNIPLIVNGARPRLAGVPDAAPQRTANKPPGSKREAARRSKASRRLTPSAQEGAPAGQSFASASLDTSGLINEARRYLGTNPTGRAHDWCGAFLDMVLKRTGHRGGGNLARAYAAYGTRIAGPAVGAIAVFTRRGGGHVGIVTGIDSNGNPIVISGNHNHRVAESTYPARRAIAYVMPGG